MGRAKRKWVFEHAQNAQIQIHTAHAQNFIRALLSIDAFYSVQWFCKRTAMTWSDCVVAQDDLGLRWSHLPENMFTLGVDHIRKRYHKVFQQTFEREERTIL